MSSVQQSDRYKLNIERRLYWPSRLFIVINSSQYLGYIVVKVSINHAIKNVDNRLTELIIKLIKNRIINIGKFKMKKSINNAVNACHSAATNAGWWNGVDVFAPHVVPAKLCLIHSEISEAMEGDRKDLMDDHLPNRKMLEVELADAAIRIFDLAGALNFDLGGAIVEKMEYNAHRADHKLENRKKNNGKKY